MFTLSKSDRIRKRADFLELSVNAFKLYTPNFIILIDKTVDPRIGFTRLGITVSKKVGNAVCRNRLKRLIREFFRTNREKFSKSNHNIIARSSAGSLCFSEVYQELANALSRIGQRYID